MVPKPFAVKRYRRADEPFVCASLTCFVKVPLPPVPEHAVGPGGRAALLTGVVILREQVVLVGGGEVQVSLDEPAEDLHKHTGRGGDAAGGECCEGAFDVYLCPRLQYMSLAKMKCFNRFSRLGGPYNLPSVEGSIMCADDDY